MSNSFTSKAEQALLNAQSVAERFGHSYIGTEHLLLSLLSIADSTACCLLKKSGIEYGRISSLVSDNKKGESHSTLTSRDTTPRLRRIIEAAYTVSRGMYCEKIGTEHLLIALLDERESIAYKMLIKVGSEPQTVKNEVIDYIKGAQINLKGAICSIDDSQIQCLVKYGKNMTRYAKEIGYEPIVERDAETARLIRILTRKNKNNPCLIGEAGVGKTAIVEGLAMKIASGDVPEPLRDKIIFSVDLTSMVAGAKYRGDFEERIKSIIKEARRFPQIIMFIDEIHTIVGAGAAEGAIDAANILKPELARGDIKLIGATTISEYRKYIEKDAALERRFQAVLIEEPTKRQTVNILTSIRKKYEEYHKTVIDDEAIETAVNLSSRFITDRYLPDKAIDLIDEACAFVKTIESNNRDDSADFVNNYLEYNRITASKAMDMGNEIKPEYPARVTKRVIESLVSEITGIDVSCHAKKDISRIKENLRARVVGQEDAVETLSRALLKSFVGLSDPNKPRGVFLFLGESGVGKTELAKALSEELFCGEDALIRYDMTEFSETGAVSKIIGASPGYIGYDETNSLLEKIRLHPYSVILLDEIEKAHPDVLSLFLNIFDEGKITDSTGRKINFRNAYIIMTSNIGNDAHKIKGATGFIDEGDRDVRRGLKQYFSEEFINRIDEIVVFNRLGYEDLVKISQGAINKIQRNIETLGIRCNIAYDVAHYFAKNSEKRSLGARQLIRNISDEIEGCVADRLVSNNPSRDDLIVVEIKDGELKVELKQGALAEGTEK